MIKRYSLLYIMAFLLATAVKASPSTASLEKFSYVVVVPAGEVAHISDSLFYKMARKVIFPVNKYDIPDTSSFRREISEELMPYMNDNSYRLTQVLIRGAASPEGPYEGNVRLSKLRTKALIDLIRSKSTVPIGDMLETSEIAEDYEYLLMLMKENNDPDYDRVRVIVDWWLDKDIKQLKEQLMLVDKKQLWNRLLRQYFPQMRAANVVLIFKRYFELEANPIEPPKPKVVIPPYTGIPTPQPPVPEVVEPTRQPRREMLAVKTNLLFDFAYMPGYDRFCPIPNVAIEYFPLHGHFTFGASFDNPWWQDYWDHKYFQVRNYQLETRYYFRSGDVDQVGYGNGAAFKGWYAQAYAHVGLYGICFDEHRGWMGEGAGGGLGIGYVLPLSRNQHWRLELGLQVGYFITKYDPFQYECPVDPTENDHLYYYKWTLDASLFKKRQHHFTWIGPTRVGITLSYDLLYRRQAKKGVSFKNYELAE